MPWDKGFDFRASAAYVTDPTNCTYVIETSPGSGVGETYPVTRNTVTFGYVAGRESGSVRDRISTAGQEKIAGRHAGNAGANGANARQFRVDLPATGDYDIYLALGDPSGGETAVNSKLYDGTISGTLLATINPTAPSSGQFIDATATLRTSAANWLSSNVKITKTFATTIFTITLENDAPISHVFLSQVGGVITPLTFTGTDSLAGGELL